METRNILDSLGNIIGTLSLPEGTSESTWSEKLSPYATEPTIAEKAEVIEITEKSATSSVTTSSSQPATIEGMLDKPKAGTYQVIFNGSISTGGASAAGKFGIYIDDVLIPETLRPISCNLQLLGGLVTVSLNTIGLGTQTAKKITLNGNQTIDIKFFSTNGGSIGFGERILTLMRVK